MKRKNTRTPKARTLSRRPLLYSNRNYHSYLTALCPIEVIGGSDRVANELRVEFSNNQQQHSPFKKCPMVHMVRLQIIDHIRTGMGNRKADALKSKYLLLIADVDGEIADFLDCLYYECRDFVQNVWGRCLGFPRHRGPLFFRRYIEQCTVKTHLPYGSFVAPVNEILLALDTQSRLAEWIDEHHRTHGVDLSKCWRELENTLDSRPDPTPGGPQFIEEDVHAHRPRSRDEIVIAEGQQREHAS